MGRCDFGDIVGDLDLQFPGLRGGEKRKEGRKKGKEKGGGRGGEPHCRRRDRHDRCSQCPLSENMKEKKRGEEKR